MQTEENPNSLDGLGQCYHMMGNFELAIDHFEQAIQLKPQEIEFLKNRA
jgi:cytochrome c-type biogenesis protein CcmH/NrfG